MTSLHILYLFTRQQQQIQSGRAAQVELIDQNQLEEEFPVVGKAERQKGEGVKTDLEMGEEKRRGERRGMGEVIDDRQKMGG